MEPALRKVEGDDRVERHPRAARVGRSFLAWYRERPFVGGALTVLGGAELFFSGRLDVGNLHVQVGIEGFQATIIPLVLVLVGVLSVLTPQHRLFYGIIALAVAVYSLVGDNLGGFFVGMLLASVGGVMIVSWMPRRVQAGRAPAGSAQDPGAQVGAGRGSGGQGSGRRMARRRRTTGGALVLALAIAAATGFGALHPQPAAAAEPAAATPGAATSAVTGVCFLGFLGDCSSSSSSSSATPTPTPTSNGTSSEGGTNGTAGTPGAAAGSGTASDSGAAGQASGGADAPSGPALVAPASSSPVFSGRPALLQGSSLSFSGLRYLGLATVHLADGSTATVLELSMDSVTIPGFRLDTRDSTGAGTDTVATSMTFTGGVDTYCASLNGILADGSSVSYDIAHPPSTDGSIPVVRILSLEVFGITGGSSALTGFHEMIS